jgi:2-keto-4-pentenoate hydratase
VKTQQGGGMTEGNLIGAAEALVNEHRSGARFQPFATTFGLASVGDAYAVQREYVRLQMQARRTSVSGHKIGLTSKRMQEMCGINSPIAGVVLQDRARVSGASLRVSDYGRLGLEFEIAVRMGRDLVHDGRTLEIADVAAAVDAICPAFEIIDDRHADYGNLEILSLIADNAWNAGIVLGDFAKSWPDLAAIEGIVSTDGNVVDRGFGRDVLGHPFYSVAWLATHLAATGTKLRAGDIVMTGSLALTRFPDRACTYCFGLDGLGAVEVSIRP